MNDQALSRVSWVGRKKAEKGDGFVRFRLMIPVALSLLFAVGPAEPLPQDLGTVENGRYRNYLTNVELTIPDEWVFKGDGPSTGNGQMAMVESDSGITVRVWMRPLIASAADIPMGLRRLMEEKPSMRPEGWKIRSASVRDRSLSGHLGLSAVADYAQDGTPMVEYDLWVISEKTHVFFFGQAEEDKLETLQAVVERVAKSALIP